MGGADLRSRFHQFIADRGLLSDGETVIVGVSGGVDSVTLLHLLRERYRPVVVHIDYGLRPESGEDAQFVKQLAHTWGLDVTVQRAELPASENRQSAARSARYAVFERLAAERNARVVAVGHHRDDVAETLLLHLFRGTGPQGWAAMPVRRRLARGSDVLLVRPLRFAHRQEIEAFARSQGLAWREDLSNTTLSYRRNVLRNEVMPLVEHHFGPGVARRLADAAERMEAYRDAGAALGSEAAFEAVEREGQQLDVAALQQLAVPAQLGVILEALRRWAPHAPRTAETAGAVCDLIGAQTGRRVELGTVSVWREREHLAFSASLSSPPVDIPVSVGDSVEVPWGTVRVMPLPGVPQQYDPDPGVEIVDAAALQGPLRLRTWRAGDVLRPIGMEGRKRVSNLLSERGVPSSERERQLVLEAGGEIVWVVGHRLALSAAVGETTLRAVRLEWIPRS